MRKTFKKISAILCSLSLVATSSVVYHQTSVKADDERVTIVAYQYDNTGKEIEDDLNEYTDGFDTYTYLATTGTGTLKASITGVAFKHISWSKDEYKDADKNVIGSVPTVGASKSNNWTANANVAVTFSTTGYQDLNLALDLGASNKGPKNYKLTYVDADGTEQTISSAISLGNNKRMYTYKFALPETLANQDKVTVSLKLADTAALNETDIVTDSVDGGEFAINNIIVTGVEKSNSTVTDEENNTPAVVAYQYSSTGKTADTDLDEYTDGTDTYTYLATTGTGTLKASITGGADKHVSWSSDEYKDAEGTIIGYVPAVGASKSNNWSADAHVTFTFSTTGYQDLSFAFDLGATKKGPKNYQLVYVDGTGTEQTLGDRITLADNKKMYTYTVALPAALENQDAVTVSLKLADTTALNDTDIVADSVSGGEFAINNILVTGTKIEETTTTATTTIEETTDAVESSTTAENTETAESTTVVEPTTDGTETTTTVEPTTADETTTATETTTASDAKVTVAKAVIAKVAAKKKSAKKVKVTLKKLASVTGYEVKIYASKANAKKDSKALAKKDGKNIQVTVSGKKLKNKKKLFARARAYKTVNGVKKYGAWSAIKRVKVKK